MNEVAQIAALGLDQVIDSAIHDRRIVGTVTMLAAGGRVIFTRAAGLADRENGVPMQPGTRFRYASVTKLFTTAAALKLIEAGRLDPAAPVTDCLPDFRPMAPDGSRPIITINHLMSHMAGLDYDFQQPQGGPYFRAGISNGLDANRIELTGNTARLAAQPLLFQPGSAWRYSKATDVLGVVMVAICGQTLPEVIASLVTGLLGLDAAFHDQPARLAATYHDSDPAPVRFDVETAIPMAGGSVLRLDPSRIGRRDDASASGGGGMAGDTDSVLRLIEALRSGPYLPDGLRAEALRLRTPEGVPTRGPGWGSCWLGSLLCDSAAAGTVLPAGTVAWGGVYGHSWLMSPATGRSLVALTNTTFEGMIGRFAAEIAEASVSAV